MVLALLGGVAQEQAEVGVKAMVAEWEGHVLGLDQAEIVSVPVAALVSLTKRELPATI